MAFLLPMLEGAGAGLLGNSIGGLLGGSATGSAENGAMNALNSQDETFQLGMYASEIQNQEQLQVQSEAFDQMMDERSDNLRTSAAYLAVETLKNVARQISDDRPSPATGRVSSDDRLHSTADHTEGRKR
jgi:hypothetical protein